MNNSINQPTPLEQLNDVIRDTVSHISDFTKKKGDFTRNRLLNAENTIKVTLNMEGQSLNTEMISAFPDIDKRMSTSAYEMAKSKLTPDLFMSMFYEYNKTQTHNALLNDRYLLYAIDGCDFNIPYQKKSKYALKVQNGRPKKDGEPMKPYSLLHGNLLFNLTDRTYADMIIQTNAESDEREACLDMLKRIKVEPEQKYIVIMDRGYDGFNMIENCNRLGDNAYYVIRTKSGNGGIKEIANLPDKECDVEMEFKVTTSNRYYITHKDTENIHLVNAIPKKTHTKYISPNTRYQRWDFGQFETVKCRVVKFRINNSDTGKEEWEVLVTNLSRFEFPIDKMKKLYHKRWDIETSFRELKYALGAVQFHSRKDDFVEMELIAHLIMFNVVSRTINNVTVPQSDKKKYKYVLSFKDAVTLIRKYYRLFNITPFETIYAEMLGFTRPLVSGRKDKRNMKSKSAIWFVYRVA